MSEGMAARLLQDGLLAILMVLVLTGAPAVGRPPFRAAMSHRRRRRIG